MRGPCERQGDVFLCSLGKKENQERRVFGEAGGCCVPFLQFFLFKKSGFGARLARASLRGGRGRCRPCRACRSCGAARLLLALSMASSNCYCTDPRGCKSARLSRRLAARQTGLLLAMASSTTEAVRLVLTDFLLSVTPR